VTLFAFCSIHGHGAILPGIGRGVNELPADSLQKLAEQVLRPAETADFRTIRSPMMDLFRPAGGDRNRARSV
jgi:hypothetical protein